MSMIAQKIYGATDLSNGNEHTEWYNNETDFISRYDFPSGAYNKIMKYDFTPLWKEVNVSRQSEDGTTKRQP